jgi:4-hydroxy-tetrahydrodipicolinate synthase
MAAGGAGCISATANVNPAGISALYRDWQSGDADARQQRLDEVRAVFSALPMIAAMKTAIAQSRGAPDWKRLRPPLVQLTQAQERQLADAMKAAAFSIHSDAGTAAAPEPMA